MYITWLVFVTPVVSWLASAGFFSFSLLLWYMFLRSWRSDPGVITASKSDKFRVSLSVYYSFYLCW